MKSKVNHFCYEVQIKIRVLFRSIKNVFEWLPIIWKTRDWDYFHMLNLMDFQIKQMEKSFLKDPYHDNKKALKYMKLVRKLMYIHNKEDMYYWDKYVTPVENKYGGRYHDFVPATSHPNYFEMKFFWGINMTDEEKKIADQEYRDAMKIMHEKEEKAWALIFKILHKQMRSWWT